MKAHYTGMHKTIHFVMKEVYCRLHQQMTKNTYSIATHVAVLSKYPPVKLDLLETIYFQ